jgi:hypothetical protein
MLDDWEEQESVEGECDGCHQMAIQCYHICRAWQNVIHSNGMKSLKWDKETLLVDEEKFKALSSKNPDNIKWVSTHGHFCMKCVNERFVRDEEFAKGYRGKDFTLKSTQIFKDIIVFHE